MTLSPAQSRLLARINRCPKGYALTPRGFELAGNIYRRGHPYFDSLMLEIGEGR